MKSISKLSAEYLINRICFDTPSFITIALIALLLFVVIMTLIANRKAEDPVPFGETDVAQLLTVSPFRALATVPARVYNKMRHGLKENAYEPIGRPI